MIPFSLQGSYFDYTRKYCIPGLPIRLDIGYEDSPLSIVYLVPGVSDLTVFDTSWA